MPESIRCKVIKPLKSARYGVRSRGTTVDVSPDEFADHGPSGTGHLALLNRTALALRGELPVPPPEPDATDPARRLADRHLIDLRDVSGSGAGGRVLLSDIQTLVDDHA